MTYDQAKELTGWQHDNKAGQEEMERLGALLSFSTAIRLGYTRETLHRSKPGFDYIAVKTSTQPGFYKRRAKAYYSMWSRPIQSSRSLID